MRQDCGGVVSSSEAVRKRWREERERERARGEESERRQERKKKKKGKKMSGSRVTLIVKAFSTFQNPKFNPNLLKFDNSLV